MNIKKEVERVTGRTDSLYLNDFEINPLAVKTPKTHYTIEKNIKAFNMIAKKAMKKNVVPSTPTYKLRNSEIYYGSIRIMPSYIMTGGNILIEKSKVQMATEDIVTMLNIIGV